MNYKKWIKRSAAGEISALEGLAKLTEELGEVGKAMNEEGVPAILMELEHVEFMARMVRNSIRVQAGFIPERNAFEFEATYG